MCPLRYCMCWLVLCVHLKCACDAADCSCNVFFLLSQEFCLCVYTVIRHKSVCWGTAGGVFSHDCHTLTLLKWLLWRHHSAFNHGANEWSKEKTRVQVSVFLQVSLLNQLFLIDFTYLLKRMCRVFTCFWSGVIHPWAGLEMNRSCLKFSRDCNRLWCSCIYLNKFRYFVGVSFCEACWYWKYIHTVTYWSLSQHKRIFDINDYTVVVFFMWIEKKCPLKGAECPKNQFQEQPLPH